MKYEQKVQIETSEYICLVKRIDGVVAQKTLEKELIRCNDCQHFEYDHVEHVDGIPLILAHEICTRWGDGCKTSENGYCFMAERKEE